MSEVKEIKETYIEKQIGKIIEVFKLLNKIIELYKELLNLKTKPINKRIEFIKHFDRFEMVFTSDELKSLRELNYKAIKISHEQGVYNPIIISLIHNNSDESEEIRIPIAIDSYRPLVHISELLMKISKEADHLIKIFNEIIELLNKKIKQAKKEIVFVETFLKLWGLAYG